MFLLALLATVGLHAQDLDLIYAVGDLHGDLAHAKEAFKLTGLVDNQGNWVGNNATLIQTGDILDRGPNSKTLIDYLQNLQTQAENAGGKFIILMGNHELMNLQGDLRYVSAEDFLEFGSKELRESAFKGEYGSWLSSLPIAWRGNDTIFVHGGISKNWANNNENDLTTKVSLALKGGDNAILGQDGPLWYRGLHDSCEEVELSLKALGAKRMVVGHTIQKDFKIQSKCGGKLVAIDTGISSAYNGQISVLKILGNNASAIYVDSKQDLEDPL